ncbi:MAG: aldose epimerase [Geitlerinemataceae cyanobacterium]
MDRRLAKTFNMFEISQKHDIYSTYVLADQSANTIVEIVPERGGMVTRWRVRGREMLYLDRDRFAQPELSVRGGIPILFPICGNLPDNTYTDNGQSYTLKQHGFARDLPWTVAAQSIDDQASLTLVLDSNDRTRAVYPFEFQLTFTYALQGNTLSISQRYTNRSDRPMPFSTGLHPYFFVSDKTQLQFDLPAGEFLDQIEGTSHSFDGTFDWEREEIDVAFCHLGQQMATVKDATSRLSLTLEYNSIYSTLVFWTIEGKDYYCLEPWSAPRNALNSGDRLIHLHPDSSLTTLVRLRVS